MIARDREPAHGHPRPLHRSADQSARAAPESTFDAELVFAACRELDKAVEVNCRPERLDPPRRLLAMVDEMGCKVSIDTDAHARGQLAWQAYGCARVAETGIGPDRIVNAWAARRPPRLDRRPRDRRRLTPTASLSPAGATSRQDDGAFAGREGERAVDALAVAGAAGADADVAVDAVDRRRLRRRG